VIATLLPCSAPGGSTSWSWAASSWLICRGTAPRESGNSSIARSPVVLRAGPNTIGCTCCQASSASTKAARAAARRSASGAAQKPATALASPALAAAKR
jgi:hypothetical protein